MAKIGPYFETEYPRLLPLVKKYGPSDPRDMRVMKHFAKTMALGTKGKELSVLAITTTVVGSTLLRTAYIFTAVMGMLILSLGDIWIELGELRRSSPWKY
jgi:hypothetical protein